MVDYARGTPCTAVTALLCVVALLLVGPAAAQDAPEISVIGLYGFDPSVGKQATASQFSWPLNREVAAVVRYETSGYEQRKSVQVFWEVTNQDGRQLSKYSQTYQVHTGQHEAALPVTFRLDEMFGQTQLNYKVEVKLVGGARLTKHEQFLLEGPQLPEISFIDMQVAPAEGNADLRPGGEFTLSGTVKVSGNTSGRVPSLVVWALMADDTLADDPWDENPFSDSYWDWTQLDAPEGEWHIEVNGRLPLYFITGGAQQRPFEVFTVVSFDNNPVSRTVASALVTGVSGDAYISDDLDERLIRLDRNWHWKFTDLAQLQEPPQWPGQK